MMDLFVLTLDIDWAPDFAIEQIAEQLIRRNIKATWFVTHDSPAVRSLAHHPQLFERGIHPNFLANSSHGHTHEQVLGHLRSLVPLATSMRTHAFYQSTPLLSLARRHFDITIDSSLLMPHVANIQPFSVYLDSSKGELVRLPVFWEDDVEMHSPDRSWMMDHPRNRLPGLKIFNFHPMFIHLNSDSLDQYEELKKRGHFYQLARSAMEPFINTGSTGAGTCFAEYCDYVKIHQDQHYTLSDLVAYWRGR